MSALTPSMSSLVAEAGAEGWQLVEQRVGRVHVEWLLGQVVQAPAGAGVHRHRAVRSSSPTTQATVRGRRAHLATTTSGDSDRRIATAGAVVVQCRAIPTSPAGPAGGRASGTADAPGKLVRVDETAIEAFWNSHPCGDAQVGGLDQTYRGDYERFFTDYDIFRYRYERHIPTCLDRLGVAGKQLLEVGIGEGAEAEQLVRRGASYSAVDLTAAAVERTRTRLTLRGLPFERVEQASALSIPWPDDSFDVVLSHGVLHHVPDVQQAQSEIRRVLRSDGELVIMLYARWSLNYVVAIGAIRRLAVAAAYPARRHIHAGMLHRHLRNAERSGLFHYLRMTNFVHANTDGPDNPYTKVYDLPRVREDFPDFEVAEKWRTFMHAPPLPVHGLLGGSVVGWHLWVRLRPR